MNDDVLRWDPCFLIKEKEFCDFFKELSTEEKAILYIMGKGFDPRMCKGLAKLTDCVGTGKRDCLVIEFEEGEDSSSHQYSSRVQDNCRVLKELISGNWTMKTETIKMWAEDDIRKRRTGSISAGRVISKVKDINQYTDIILDISAMPQSIYFPLIGSCLALIDEKEKAISLHIVVCENVMIDMNIIDDGIDDKANYVHGFSSDLVNAATEGIPKIWIPILGEGDAVKLEKIYVLINPDEICPVLPSPSADPRQGDNILLKYRELIFDQWRVEPKNIIYANERNPFEAYRQIYRTVLHYERALKPIGGCKFVISAVSSKLISLGALLAAYELKRKNISIGLAHIEAQGYTIQEDISDFEVNNELFTLSLSGRYYE